MTTFLHKAEVAAFDSVYAQYHQAVFKNICKLVLQPEAAEDILQEVFLALWNNRHKLALTNDAARWLFVVSYNKSIQYLKTAAREKTILAAHPELPVATEDDCSALLKDLQLDLISDAIEKLSPRKKMIFQLCRLEGKSLQEAAVILGISTHTAKEYLKASSTFIKTYIAAHQATTPVAGLLFLSIYFQY
ncbi:RNA polymerase sigma factor [Chitinophaga qingshengii]|uniref:Sigma-70 family RNA polymerase sigma factor n=1 Tax=Chitinophaga qingshengii TaxID=1569794 RepID=A0ABR7TX39_9BACT|nr:sigma-70 family RNA polymerase sigma factor [Chitinophaga qingshengii]MBC9935045.1 sigma-70 family RNA polymerase sigma factor [Chitinophaga qingshengii]